MLTARVSWSHTPVQAVQPSRLEEHQQFMENKDFPGSMQPVLSGDIQHCMTIHVGVQSFNISQASLNPDVLPSAGVVHVFVQITRHCDGHKFSTSYSQQPGSNNIKEPVLDTCKRLMPHLAQPAFVKTESGPKQQTTKT
eukprot:281338-Lingulodinium_polyedra.AAC.1